MTLRLLVAEDSKTMQRVLQIAFASTDATLRLVGSAKEAQELARKEPFDALVLDAQLPDADGYSLCQSLHTLCAAPLPALLLTSGQHPYDLARGRHAGISSHLNKPFRTEELVTAVLRMTGNLPDDALAPDPQPQRQRQDEETYQFAEYVSRPAPAASDNSDDPGPAADALALMETQPGLTLQTAAAAAPATSFTNVPPSNVLPEPAQAAPAPLPAAGQSDAYFRATGLPKTMAPLPQAPPTRVREPGDALKSQARFSPRALLADDADAAPQASPPPLPSWEVPPQVVPEQDAHPAALASVESDAESRMQPPPMPTPPAEPLSYPGPFAAGAGAAASGAPTSTALLEEVVGLLQAGPHAAHTPELNAALTAALEQQLHSILWQIVPGIVEQEVRRYLHQSSSALPPP